ncbi:MAG TPA: aldehyde dehydrogenase family protein [Marmoricola sp.]|jgi:aldehyde dehydrogenase (NAD+)|nr:aldehyde dehydrogenase family protein [Marmoricola sp.]
MTTQLTPTSTAAPSEAAATLARMRRYFATGATRARSWRIGQLEALKRMLVEREREIVDAVKADLGRNDFDAWFGDVAPPSGDVEYALKHLKSWMKPQRRKVPLVQMPGKARIQYEPLGVVLVIGPWNYPVNLSLGPIVAALAAGNCVVLKPSEVAPKTSTLMAELLPQYLDSEAVAVVEGDGVITQELLAQGFDLAFFTGGTEIGKKIMAGAASTLTPVILELGGKSPVFVTADADLDVTARRIAWTKLLNSGQTCIAPDYLLVHESVKDELVAKIRGSLDDMTVEDIGGRPIVNDRQFDRLRGYLAATKGTVVSGGDIDEATRSITPAILLDPALDEPAMVEEIFGPILPVTSYTDLDEAIAFVNSRPKPLGLYVFSGSKKVADSIVERIPAGGAVINHCAVHYLVPSLPFGGVGASGMGSYHGEWGFQAFSHRKSVAVKPIKPDLRMVYPPYSEKTQKLLRKMF